MSTEIMNHSSTHCSTSQASVTVSANKLEWAFRCNMGVCRSLNIFFNNNNVIYHAYRYNHLVLAFERNQGTGILGLLHEPGGDGRVLVTMSSAIAKRITHHLASGRPNTNTPILHTAPDRTSPPAAAGGAASSPLSTTRDDAAVICSNIHVVLHTGGANPQYQQWLLAIASSSNQATQVAH